MQNSTNLWWVRYRLWVSIPYDFMGLWWNPFRLPKFLDTSSRLPSICRLCGKRQGCSANQDRRFMEVAGGVARALIEIPNYSKVRSCTNRVCCFLITGPCNSTTLRPFLRNMQSGLHDWMIAVPTFPNFSAITLRRISKWKCWSQLLDPPAVSFNYQRVTRSSPVGGSCWLHQLTWSQKDAKFGGCTEENSLRYSGHAFGGVKYCWILPFFLAA